MGEEVQLVLIEAVEAAMQSALLITEEVRLGNNQEQEKTLFFTLYSLQRCFFVLIIAQGGKPERNAISQDETGSKQ